MEPTEAKDLIDEAIERAEEQHDSEVALERASEKRFRDRVSLLVGLFAVLLAIVHMAAAGAQRESLLQGIAASDTFAYGSASEGTVQQLQAMIESVNFVPIVRGRVVEGGKPVDFSHLYYST